MQNLETEVLVIGSGPGGATTAAMLAEQGHQVLLVEEGADLSIDSAESYSIAEMDQKYRNGGLTTTVGKTNVTYIEGRCVGGASEINAALYHRPHDETVERWAREFRIRDFTPQGLGDHFSALENEMQVCRRPGELSPNSRLLQRGSDKLGWKSTEIERFWSYANKDDRAGRRRSMTETMIPRFRAAGGRLQPDTRVRRLLFEGNKATWAEARCHGKTLRIRFKDVFVCAGAVQTPTLLRRSGVLTNVGEQLRIHPMVRIAARFPDALNDPHWGVPVRQVEEFKPNLTLGCSHSSFPHIALWLGQEVEDKKAILQQWRSIAVFYAAVCGESTGTVRSLPLLDEPFIRYDLSERDMSLLGEGLVRLGELVFAAGATEIFSPIEGQPSITEPSQLERVRKVPHGGKVNITTIHLFSSCPMGTSTVCAADSHGKMHGLDNVYINDASLLPTSPGVNPQGTIMAIARRNAARFLGA